jgi:ankyrin repeat protein
MSDELYETAWRQYDAKTCLKAINQGADPNKSIDGKGRCKYSKARMRAIEPNAMPSNQSGWDELSKALLLHLDINVNHRDDDMMTPLLLCCRWEDNQGVDQLIKAGARLDAGDKFGMTALMVAACNGNTAMVQTLLKAGAKPNQENHRGETAELVIEHMEAVRFDATKNFDATKKLLKAYTQGQQLDQLTDKSGPASKGPRL